MMWVVMFMNLDVLRRELTYAIEDELKENQIQSYPEMEQDIEDLISFFLNQGCELHMIPDYVLQMFLNPPEVIFIKENGEMKRITLTANGLHEQALVKYANEYLDFHPDDEELEMILYEAEEKSKARELEVALKERGITCVRLYHDSIHSETIVTITPPYGDVVAEKYQELQEQLTKEKKGKIQFGVYALDCEEYHVSDTSKGY